MLTLHGALQYGGRNGHANEAGSRDERPAADDHVSRHGLTSSGEKRMAQEEAALTGPDLVQGLPLAELADGGKLVGHAGGEQVLLVRRGTEIFAVGALCTHYHAPLVDGLVVDDTV